jgi:DNA-binding transcriptional ArsR family regulator
VNRPGDPFAALADPTRRRILELLADGERTAGDVTTDVRAETGLSQPAVSQHLAVLREAGLVVVRVDGPRRIYSVRPEALRLVTAWVDHVLPSFEQPLDALATEVARGRRDRRAKRAWRARGGGDVVPPHAAV